MIAFTLNGTPVQTAARPTTTLLDWLRDDARLTGTKEGCAEGDCGACTVVLEDGQARAPINACLAVLGQLHGRRIRTVEGLPPDLPRILAEADGTQCGFCTPGIVMAAWAHTRQRGVDAGDAHEALAGNLCRCTGYRPIMEALAQMTDDGARAPAAAPEPAGFGGFHAPIRLADALALRRAHPAAWLLAGGTDLGLRFSEHREHPEQVIYLGNVAELRGAVATSGGLRVGAAEPYAGLMPLLTRRFASLRPYFARLGSRQIRAMGTLGGNLGTASPIGDALPVLLALEAVVVTSARRLKVDEFLLGYRRHALAADEIIVAIELPSPDGPLFAEKISRRHDQDISAVSLVACLGARPRIALGGMGPMALRARAAEAALRGRSRADFQAAAAALAQDVTPMDDWRGTAAWRLAAARGLMQRLWLRLEHPDLPAEAFAVPA